MIFALIGVFPFARIKAFVIMARGGLVRGDGGVSGVQGASVPARAAFLDRAYVLGGVVRSQPFGGAPRSQPSGWRDIGPYSLRVSSKSVTWSTPPSTSSRQFSPSQLSASPWLAKMVSR